MQMKEITYKEALREAMVEEMRRDEDIIFLGEDIGVYGGGFGVSYGMIEEFGEERVRDTPISEAAIAGCYNNSNGRNSKSSGKNEIYVWWKGSGSNGS